ncbi:tyrosine-type recombinase/integrase [Streptomyces sp. 110]|uniref:Tyrosine-type recombinase/integrase n=1 Tax=Streptomyces endocoffeicus TaxID=2898945 RepID=A0ABS1Q694_9ACTN|nr:tyrosine-type recombinase/integrase [Streptomyces endocoffeicus]
MPRGRNAPSPSRVPDTIQSPEANASGTRRPVDARADPILGGPLNECPLTKLTAKDIRTWLSQLRTTCQCCARHRRPARPASLLCHRPVLPQAAVTLASVHSVLKSALEREPLTVDEARQLLTSAHEHRLHALFEIALHTGLRQGELLGLHWKDLDLHSTAKLFLEQGVELVVTKELLGHAHIGVTVGVYAHVRLRLQRQAIDILGNTLGPADTPDDPPSAVVVR